MRYLKPFFLAGHIFSCKPFTDKRTPKPILSQALKLLGFKRQSARTCLLKGCITWTAEKSFWTARVRLILFYAMAPVASNFLQLADCLLADLDITVSDWKDFEILSLKTKQKNFTLKPLDTTIFAIFTSLTWRSTFLGIFFTWFFYFYIPLGG